MAPTSSSPKSGVGASPGSHATELSRSQYSGQVAATLREAIVAGQLRRNVPLVEARLARELKVSRGPVRSALQVLEGEGLVRTLDNGRTVVTGFTQTEARDLFRVRYTLESTAIRWGIQRHRDPSGIRDAVSALAESDASPAVVVDLDLRFHRALLEFSGSRHLMQSWLAMAPVIHAMITIGNRRLAVTERDFNLERIVDAHRSLAVLIMAGDAGAAAALLKRQFGEVVPLYVQLTLETP